MLSITATTVYSGEVISKQAFLKDLHVKPVLGYYNSMMI